MENKNELSSSSLTRTFSSLDPIKFVFFTSILSATRTTLMHPLTVVLTTVRSQPKSCSSSTITVSQEFRSNKFRYFFTGLPVFAAGTAVSEALYLLYFEYMRESNFLSSSSSSSTLLSQDSKDFLSGFFADGFRQFLIIPFSVVATTQITRRRFESKSSSSKMKHVVKNLMMLHHHHKGSFRPFFAGLGTSLAIGPLWTALWWWLYGKSKRHLYHQHQQIEIKKDNDHDESRRKKQQLLLLAPLDNVFINTAASIFASATAAVVFNPFLVVRTRLMAHQHGGKLKLILKDLFANSKSGGIKMLFAGTVGTMGFSVVDGIGASLTYEYAKAWSERK